MAKEVKEVTGGQLLSGGEEELLQPLSQSWATYRTVRTHPTVALARALSVAPVVAAEWSVEASDEASDDWVAMIQKEIIPWREPIVETGMYGGVDFGWQAFETVFVPREGYIGIKRVKPLLHDITKIMVDKITGAYTGVKQEETFVPAEQTLLLSFRVEGTNWYGESLLENARLIYNQWLQANNGAARYDKKIAGSHIVIRYPIGSTEIDGVEKPNNEIAQDIIASIQSSGIIAIPIRLAPYVEDLDQHKEENEAWSIKFESDSVARQYSFVPRLQYLDVQLIRALLVPERAIIEGRFGTKAEAGEHADIALTHMELVHRHITRLVNWHLVDRLLALNFGEETRGLVWLKPAPLADEKLQYLRGVYETALKSPTGFMDEQAAIDWDALKDTLGIPKSQEVTNVDDTGTEPVEVDES